MKKLIIILLIGMLSLGLSGIAFADESDDAVVSATIGTSVAITTNPVDPSGTNVTSLGNWEPTATIVIAANCPYNIDVKYTSSAWPTGETTPDEFMTASVSPYTDLGTAFALGYDSATSAATSTDGTPMALATAITSTDQAFISCPLDPENGEDTVGIKYRQVTTLADPSYELVGDVQLSYQIKLTWTASVSIS
jgi:hypothetical protein